MEKYNTACPKTSSQLHYNIQDLIDIKILIIFKTNQ